MNTINQRPNTQSSDRFNSIPEPIKTSFEKQAYDERRSRERYIQAIQKIANEWSKTAMVTENRYYKIQFSEPDFTLKDMDDRYSNERVTYFTEKGLEELQVFAINGLLYSSNLKLCNTSKKLDVENGDGEMLVMDRLGSMFIAPKERGTFHHSSFFSGQPVAFAALCEVKDGKIQNIKRYSGHYTPGPREESSFEMQLNTQYLKPEPTFSSLKLDENGNLVQTISIFSKQKAEELYDLVAKVGGFARPRLRLICNGEPVATASSINNKTTVLISETKLKSGSRIFAFEYSSTPLYRTYPSSHFELTINDPEEDTKLSTETNQKSNAIINQLQCHACSKQELSSSQLIYTSCCFQKVCSLCDQALKNCFHCKTQLGELRIQFGWNTFDTKNSSILRLLPGNHTTSSIIQTVKQLFPHIETQLTNRPIIKILDSKKDWNYYDGEVTNNHQYFLQNMRLPHHHITNFEIKSWIVALLTSGKLLTSSPLTKEEIQKKCNSYAARITSSNLSQEQINSLIASLVDDGYCEFDEKTNTYKYLN